MAERYEEAIPEAGGYRARLRLWEIDGGPSGMFWEAMNGNDYLGSFTNLRDVCERFGNRTAEVYTYAAYEALCLRIMEADPEAWDTSGAIPMPVLCRVRTVEEIITRNGWES